MIEQSDIFKPLLAQAGLMIFLAFWLVWARVGSLIRGKITQAEVDEKGWQGWIKNAGDNYSNQYEMPLLFFAVCFVLYLTNAVTPMVMGLAWFFFVSRIIHSLIHLGKNIIMLRFFVFLAGALALTALVIIAMRAAF